MTVSYVSQISQYLWLIDLTFFNGRMSRFPELVCIHFDVGRADECF